MPLTMIPSIVLTLLLTYVKGQPPLGRCVDTKLGQICGTTSPYGDVQAYLGVPYATPPVGKYRFQRPQPVAPWGGTLMANQWPPACPQYTEYPMPWYDPYPGQNEDCLYLNIFAPSCTEIGDDKAVMIWFYGGGFTFGSNRLELYDGSALASEGDVIIVTVNYRVGLFGFLTSGTDDAPGNYAVYDMLASMQWVQANIAAFGGSPDKVTLAGESAGSIAISLLCTSPLTKGLFSKMIMQSGSAVLPTPDPYQNNIEMSQKVAEAVGCASKSNTIRRRPKRVLKCLRGKTYTELAPVLYGLNPNRVIFFLPEYVNELFPTDPTTAFTTGTFHNVPILIGNDQDEGSPRLVLSDPEFFGVLGRNNPLVNKTTAERFMQKIFEGYPDIDSVVRHYLASVDDDDFEGIRYQLHTATGDYALLCPTVYFAESYAARGNDVYFYFYQHRPSTRTWAKWMGVPHFEEVQIVFGLPLMKSERYQQEEAWLSARIIKLWTDFIKFGYPDDTCEWPKYNKEDHIYRSLYLNNEGLGIGPHLDNCNFFRDFFGF